MLVLSRRVGQTYFVGDGELITTTILEVKGCYVKLGISAPKDIPILRKEVLLVHPKFRSQKLQDNLGYV